MEPQSVQIKASVQSFDYNNALKVLTAQIASQIPEVGFIISGLVAVFWPNATTNVWDQIRDKVQQLVDKAIINFATKQRQHELDAINSKMNSYAQAKGDQKGNFLTQILGSLIDLYQKLTDKDNRKFYLPIISTTGAMHLLVLTERLMHGKEIYDTPNQKYWLEQLNQYDQKYRNLISQSFSQWRDWYNSQITVSYYSSLIPSILPMFHAYGIVKNKMTGQHVNFESKDTNSIDDYFKINCQLVKIRMLNEGVNKMIDTLICFYYASKTLARNNGLQNLPASLSEFELGPYGPELFNDSYDRAYESLQDGLIQGNAQKIQVRYYNSIDGLGFQGNGQRKFVGNENGGKSDFFDIKNQNGKNINGMTLQFAKGVCAAVILHKQVGSDITGLGDFDDWGGIYVSAKPISPGYLLNGGEFAYGHGSQGSIRAIKTLKLKFKYRPTI